VLEQVAAHTRVLVLTTFDEDSEMLQSLRQGAHGYLLKSATPDSIVHAIVEISRGNTVYDTAAMDAVRRTLPNVGGKLAELTEREDDIVSLIAQGLNNKRIAEMLYLSEGTVKNHITTILQKTGLEHRTQIAIHRLKGEL
jgi:DNA-binding NarL/FixJ family response regulator